ncbi:MAG: T9SS type A sorting domain-containing protein [Bacteroidales bacterium]
MKILYNILVIFLFSLTPLFCYTQVTLSLPSSQSCPGNFEIPVEAQNFNNVASVSLKIKYDTTILQYDTHTNVNPAFNAGMFLINAVKEEVIFSWFALNPVNLGNTTLLKLHFHHLLNTNTQIEWNADSLGNCVITDINGIELPLELTDASLSTTFDKPQPVTPSNQATNISENPVFHWNGSGCGPHYHLIYSGDPDFLSDTNSTYNIFGTSLPVSGLEYDKTYYWKVKAVIHTTPYYTEWSEIFSFTTRNPDGIEPSSEPGIKIQLSPNPAREYFNVKLELVKKTVIHVQFVDITGRVIYDPGNEEFLPGIHIREIDVNRFNAGIYFLRIISVSSDVSHVNTEKLIIIR